MAEDPMQGGGHVWLRVESGGFDTCRCGMFRFAYYAHGHVSRRPCPLAAAAADLPDRPVHYQQAPNASALQVADPPEPSPQLPL